MTWPEQPEQPGRPEQRSSSEPYFFLSYARTPRQDPADRYDPDRWVHKLYRDLCENIFNLTNAPPGTAGFMDRQNRPGAQWPSELAKALATCRVFVPLYSPRYFESMNCGKEWFAFTLRALNQNQKKRKAKAVPAIVPALWVKVADEKLPDVARVIQFNHHKFGTRYGDEGFYGIMKVNRYRHDYQIAVYELAKRIVEVAKHTRIDPEEPTDYMRLESAFRLDGAPPASQRQLHLTVVAAGTSSLPAGRGPYYYGAGAHQWNPYRPETSQPVADYAADLARCLSIRPTVRILDESIAAGDREPVTPGLYLVDAWATQLPQYREWLRRLDERDQPCASVIVPWNKDDTETAAAEERLRAGLEECLGRMLARVPHNCRPAAAGIPTFQEFGHLLALMATTLIGQYLKEAPAYPPDGVTAERPRLLLPDPEDHGG